MVYNRKDLAVQVGLTQNKGYTMKEISNLEARIKNIEYYTVLNMLALDTKTTTVKNDAGFERFKNGIFADPFNDDSIARTNDVEFNMAISAKKSIARPNYNEAFVQFNIDSNTTTGVKIKGGYALLNYTNENIGGNPNASIYRNCAETFFSFKGVVSLYPNFDNSNQNKNAVPQTIVVDIASAFQDQAKTGAFKNIDAVETGAKTLVSKIGATNYWQQTQTQTVTDIAVTSTPATQDLGDFVKDVSLLPYMVSRPIAFVGNGLKPNTIIYPFFDKKLVSQYCAPATMDTTFVLNGPNDPSKIAKQSGNLGDVLKTNSLGNVVGIFFLPANTFRAGERVFTLIDTQNIDAVDAILTSAEGRYTSSSLSTTKQNLKFEVDEPTFTPTTVTNKLPPLAWTTTDPPPPPPPSDATGGTGGCCFDPNALVSMSDGSYKKICEIQINDIVIDGSNGINVVTGIETPKLLDRYMVSFNNNWAFISEEHPIMTSEGWGAFEPESRHVDEIFVGKLVKIDIGSKILKSDGTYETIETINYKTMPEDYIIYNLLLDGDHMYHVEGYVVHNKGNDTGGGTTTGSMHPDSYGNYNTQSHGGV
jgi:hypothetical protein